MAKNCLIYETLEPVKNLSISKDGGLMTLTGVFGVCGVRNNNKRVYEAGNYGKMVTEMKQRIKSEGGIPGELEHPQTMNVTLENISHKITDINIDENGVVTGTIALLNTPKGKIAQAIVEGGLPLFISSRATGNVDKNGAVMLERIATYDLVGTPGFSQAKLHLNENQVAESLNESLYVIYENENNKDKDMLDEKILERLEQLEERINQLETENEELREQLEDVETSRSHINEEQLKQLAQGIQKWIIEEYSPVVESWIMEDFKGEVDESVQDTIMSNVDVISEAMQKWIVNEYTPVVESWIYNEYTPVVENWTKTEFATGIQNWVVEQFSPELENWLNESYSIKVDDMIKESKGNKLGDIDKMLNMLESISDTKPAYKGKANLITENINEPIYIKNMPDEIRPKYNMASPEVKESIDRRAKLYNFANEGAVARFWNNIDFNQVKPANVYEGLEKYENVHERGIRSSIRSWRNRNTNR